MAMIVKAKTFEAWFKANFTREEMRDLAKFGADSGFHGLTYYTDTVKLYDRFNDEVWEALNQDAEDFGQSPLELIASFGGAKSVATDCQFKNLLVWYIAERTARELTEK